MSKGSGRRPVDEKAYQDNWNKIFSEAKKLQKQRIVKFVKEDINETLPDIGHPQPSRKDPTTGS